MPSFLDTNTDHNLFTLHAEFMRRKTSNVCINSIFTRFCDWRKNLLMIKVGIWKQTIFIKKLTKFGFVRVFVVFSVHSILFTVQEAEGKFTSWFFLELQNLLDTYICNFPNKSFISYWRGLKRSYALFKFFNTLIPRYLRPSFLTIPTIYDEFY